MKHVIRQPLDKLKVCKLPNYPLPAILSLLLLLLFSLPCSHSNFHFHSCFHSRFYTSLNSQLSSLNSLPWLAALAQRPIKLAPTFTPLSSALLTPKRQATRLEKTRNVMLINVFYNQVSLLYCRPSLLHLQNASTESNIRWPDKLLVGQIIYPPLCRSSAPYTAHEILNILSGVKPWWAITPMFYLT